jgi:hypothetical protein
MRAFDLSGLLTSLHHRLHAMKHRGERHRIWSANTTTLILLAMVNPSCSAGYRRSIAAVHEELGDELGWSQAPDVAGFARARRELLKTDDLIAVQRDLAQDERARSMSEAGRWKGLRVVAVDGSWWLLPASQELIEHYGRPKAGASEAYQPQVLVTTLWDTGSLQPIAWDDQPCGGSERAAVWSMRGHLHRDDILVADRGLASHDLLVDLAMAKQPFIFRMISKERGSFKELRPFIRNRKIKDQTIRISCPNPECTPPPAEDIRFVKRRNLDGTWTILATNLPPDLATIDELFDLYKRRWAIELAYRDIKIRYRAENFHGTSVEFIRQEIAAVFILLTIESMLDGVVHDSIPGNRRLSRAALGDRLTRVIATAWRSCRSKARREAIARGLSAVARITIPDRPGRSYPRRCKSQYGRWRFDRFRKGKGAAVQPMTAAKVA